MSPLFHKTALILFLFVTTPLQAEYEQASSGMVASRSDLASEVGRDIMQAGGNAVDAAVATGFALAVTYPSAGNLGGGGFMLLRLADGETVALDFRETAPAAATREMFQNEEGNVDRQLSLSSHLSSGVPGTVAGLLDALERYGTLSREQVLAPAIRLAEDGFLLNDDIASQFQENLDSFRPHPASWRKFTQDDEVYAAGDLWQQPQLAATLKRIAAQGHKGFYQGETADLLVEEMQRGGGLITLADLRDYQTVWREPVHGSYRGYDIWSMPAPSSGGILLIQMLNMLEPFQLGESGWGNADTIHLMIEAQRRAYADRAEHLGDPEFYDVPAQELIDKDYARQRFSTFDPQRASDSEDIGAGSWPNESTQTTHYSIVDAQGNAVSTTTTLNRAYGNGIVVEGAGFLLNNEMDDFSSKPNTPNAYGLIGREANAIEPHKRMLSSMAPTIVSQGDTMLLVTGTPGGSTIITTILQVIINIIDHGMGIEEAVSQPRFHHQWMPNIVRYEEGAIAADTVEALRAMGHQGVIGSRFGLGDANSILMTGELLEGMSDPRNVGGTAGF